MNQMLSPRLAQSSSGRDIPDSRGSQSRKRHCSFPAAVPAQALVSPSQCGAPSWAWAPSTPFKGNSLPMANGHSHHGPGGTGSQWGRRNDGGNRGAPAHRDAPGPSHTAGTGFCWGHGGSTRPLLPGNGVRHRGRGKALSLLTLTKSDPSSGLHHQRDPRSWKTLLPQPDLLPVTHINPEFLCTGVYSELTLTDKQVFPLFPHTINR